MGSIKKTETGSVLNFNTYLPKQLTETKISFTPQQSGSGTPSPENVREIVGKNGITVVQSGKNLYSRTDGKPDYIPLKKDTVISARGYFRVVMYDENMTQVDYASLSGGIKNGITLKKDVTYIGFNPEQEGYDYQIELGSTVTEYEPFTGVETSVSFPAVGKNLCPDISTWESGYTNNAGGIFPANSTRLEKYSDYIPVDGSENYTFSYNADGITEQLWTCICAYDENKEFLARHISNNNFVSRKLIAKTHFVRLSLRTYGMTAEAQFEKSAEPTAYEPFDNTVYGGYVDAENGEVVEEYVYRDMTTFSSIKAPSGTSEPWNHRFALQHWANNTVGYDRVAGAQVMCDCIDTANGSGRTNYTGDASTAVWYVYDDTISTVAEFKEKYAGHYVAYRRKVALHEHYSLTPQSIATLRGSNVMWSDGDSLTISYTDDVVNTYDFRRHISLDTPHKANASGAVASFGTDMVGRMKCKIHFLPKQSGSGTPSPDNVREIVGKNGITVWQSNKGVFHNLPSTYQEVEYIEGTGTQKIDTGIVIDDSNFNISCRFVLPEYYGTGEYPVFSIWRASPNYFNCFVRVANRKMSVYTAGHHQPNTTIIEEGVINDIALSRTDTTWNFTHNEETINWTYSPTTSNNTTLKVFTRGDGNAASHIRVYSLTVEVEGELVGDFVPCYRKSDSVAGLYDLVTKTFFTNYADDTNFVVGEDIVGVETSVSFPSTVGDNGMVYGGYVDLVNGEVVAEYAKIQLSDFTWTYSSGWSNADTYCVYVNGFNGDAYFKSYDTKPWFCNVLPAAARNEAYTGTYRNSACFCFSGSISKGTPTLRLPSASVSSIEEATKYIADNNMIAVYKIAEPIHYSLTPQSIATLRGANRIWSDGDSVEVEYYKHTDEPQVYLPIDAIVTNNGFVLVTSDGYAVGETNDYIKY